METPQGPNLPRAFYPCCGHVCDSAGDLEGMSEGIERAIEPSSGDLTICINCGSILVFTDGAANKTRLAIRQDVERLDRRQRRILATAQKIILKRGPIQKRQ